MDQKRPTHPSYVRPAHAVQHGAQYPTKHGPKPLHPKLPDAATGLPNTTTNVGPEPPRDEANTNTKCPG